MSGSNCTMVYHQQQREVRHIEGYDALIILKRNAKPPEPREVPLKACKQSAATSRRPEGTHVPVKAHKQAAP